MCVEEQQLERGSICPFFSTHIPFLRSLNPLKSNLPKILELELREWNAVEQRGFEGTAEVLEFLVSLPSNAAVNTSGL